LRRRLEQEARTIALRNWLQALTRWVSRACEQQRPTRRQEPREAAAVVYQPLRRLLLTDEVSRTLFAEFAEHRASERGGEETGWALLGLRNADEAIALATLPAGANREAGDAHVLQNSTAQAFAYRVLFQANRKLKMLGVVHTHPGSMRHPSSGDYRGDIAWVAGLPGEQGVFAIGTADAGQKGSVECGWKPAANAQCLGELCLSWYSLRGGERNYRPLPVDLTLGPDLGLVLRPVWPELENHAERLDRLARQLRRAAFDVVPGRDKPALVMQVPVADGDKTIRVLMEGKDVRYLLVGPDGAMIADFRDDRVDHGVFVMLAELTS
jgi:proteasome lid subunit RPN8/RPN11